MNELHYQRELSKCVRCGACKAFCPTYLIAPDETMGARGRVAMLGALMEKKLLPTRRLSDKIFSCILCGACRGMCPTGIDILEAIYYGRTKLKDSYVKGRLLIKGIRFSLSRMDSVFSILKGMQKIFYHPLYRVCKLPYIHIPEIASVPFRHVPQVYRNTDSPASRNRPVPGKINRVAIFVGCSINYFYPRVGFSLLNILITMGYEVVVLKSEVCCGAPMRSLGLEEETIALAKKNVEVFNRIKAQAILSMCPTCTMTIKKEYPLLIGDTIEKVIDVNEFFAKNGIVDGLKTIHRVVTYHDPCYLNYGSGIKEEPREILKNIAGIEFVEMQDAEGCCGFGGFFSINFKDLSQEIGRKKMGDIYNTHADTLVTSCPGCMTQLENLRRKNNSQIDIMHMVEIIDEAMHGR